jgi:hypothetical protein
VPAVTSNPRPAPLFDVDLQTGATIEIFYTDRTLETFGRCGAGWFWQSRLRGFPSLVKTPFTGFGKSKARLDKAVLDMHKRFKKGAKAEPLPNWTLHDLRRTAKTLMARAGVRPDISERVLGHVIAGVEGTYDRHSYADEKRDALEKLAAMIDRILNPPPSNVENLGDHRARA